MIIDVLVPQDLWEEDSDAVISAWLFEDGDRVNTGDILAEIMIEKVTHELLAPASGVLKLLVAAEDETVVKGDKLAEIS